MQVFISYAREDQQAAKRVYDSLQSLPKVNPWLDTENLLSGENWKIAIGNAMRNSQIIVLLLSPHSVSKDGYVQKEFRNAIEISEEKPPGKIFLIPVKLLPCEPQFDALNALQYTNLYPDWDMGITRVIEAIKREQVILNESTINTLHGQSENGIAIGPGLKSFARVTNGVLRYTKCSVQSAPILELIRTVARGFIKRNSEGSIDVFLEMHPISRGFAELSQKLDLGSVQLTTQSTLLSTDPTNPTVLEGAKLVVLPKGIEIPDMRNIEARNTLPVTVVMS